MAVTLRYFTEFGKPALQKTICGGIYARGYCRPILVRVQCRRKESSRSLSHLLMSFLLIIIIIINDLMTMPLVRRVASVVELTTASASGGARPGPAGARAPAGKACAPAVPRRQSGSKLMELTRRLNDALQ